MFRRSVLRGHKVVSVNSPEPMLKTTRLWVPERFDPMTVTTLGNTTVLRKPGAMSERSKVLRFTTPPSRLNRKYALGFVPTMGALHDAHMALIEASQAECVFTAVSIYVNPKQFQGGEELSYPQQLERDLRLLAEAEVDVVFVPSNDDMYPAGFSTYVDNDGASDLEEGKHRPGHFKGVATVCTKLFNIVRPSMVYVGQKDALQSIVLRSLIRDLNMDTALTACPIVREIDGLAMSSRNVFLTAEDRREAPAIFSGIQKVNDFYTKTALHDNRKKLMDLPKVATIKAMLKEEYSKQLKIGTLEYISVGNAVDMTELADDAEVAKGAFLSVVVKYGSTRLLDAARLGYGEEDYWTS